MVLWAVKISQVSSELSLYLDGSVQYTLPLLAAKIGASQAGASSVYTEHMD